MVSKKKCPHCESPTRKKDNPYWPFCSKRCRLIDLGHWFNGDYTIPTDDAELKEEEKAELDKETKSPIVH